MISNHMNVENVINIDEESLSDFFILGQQWDRNQGKFLNEILEVIGI